MSRPIRVAHVITRLCQGGAQENTFHSVRLARRDRFEVDLVSGPTSGDEGSIEPRVEAAGIEIVRVPDLVRRVDPLRDWRALRALTALFRERRYDIVHTHTSKAGLLGRVAARRAGVPVVVHTPHGHIFHGYFSGPVTAFFVLLERYAARRSDRLIALTERGIREHLDRGVGRPEQWLSIFSGIDLAPFEQARTRREEVRRRLGVDNGELLVGAVGRLEAVKGFAYFIDAARVVLAAAPRARFVLAGDGSLAGTLRERARDLGARFQFLGLRDDVPELMAAMDLFVLPSLNEGMGRVLLEAGAAALPRVATAVGGVPDIIADGITGALVPPADPDALAQAMLRLLADPAQRERLGTAAHGAVVPAYGLEHMVARLEDLYEQLLKEKGI